MCPTCAQPLQAYACTRLSPQGRGPFLLDDEHRANYYAAMGAGGGGTASSYTPLMGGEERVAAPQGAPMSTGGVV